MTWRRATSLASFERASEAVLVERRSVTRRRLDHAERLESFRGRRAIARSRRGVASATSHLVRRDDRPRALGSPRRDRPRARRPRTIATPSTACARPVRDAATFDRARRPRRGGRRARDCRARCATPSGSAPTSTWSCRCGSPCRLTPCVKPTIRTPPPGVVAVLSPATIAHDQRVLFEIVDRRTDRRAMRAPRRRRRARRRSRAGSTSAEAPRPRCRSRGPRIARVVRSTSLTVRGSLRVTGAAKPPTGSALAQALDLEGAVIGEVTDVVRTARQDSDHWTPRCPTVARARRRSSWRARVRPWRTSASRRPRPHRRATSVDRGTARC